MARVRLAVFSLLLLVLAVCGQSAVQYKCVDLGFDGIAYGINDKGEIVGRIDPAPRVSHAFLWKNGVVQDLGALGGTSSEATAINNKGQIAGTIAKNQMEPNYVFLYDNGVVRDYACNADTVQANSINENGDIVGRILTEDSVSGYHWSRAYIWSNGKATALPGLVPGLEAAAATDINDSGIIVGGASRKTSFSDGNSNYYGCSVYWQNGQIYDLEPPANYSFGARGFSINNKGQIAGMFDGQVCMWQNGVRTDFGINGKHVSPIDINDKGQVIITEPAGNQLQYYRAMLWQDGEVQSLDGLNPRDISVANSLNEDGWIAGCSIGSDYIPRACVWIPVPEPSCLPVLLTGLAGMAGLALRRRSR